MYNLFGDEGKRKINLGGVSSAVSHATLIDRTRALRNERLEQQRRNEKALQIQAWWRGMKEARGARKDMRKFFEEDVTSLNAMRYLIIVGEKDAQALAIWSSEMAARGPATLFLFERQPHFRHSWLTLVKRIALLLLNSVASSPLSSAAIPHLNVLSMLLSREASNASSEHTTEITKYLLRRDFHKSISRSILSTPLELRQSPSLALIVPLVTIPFQNFQQTSTLLYKETLNALFRHIFTIPLLPNRVSTASLTHLSAHVPFIHLSLLEVDDIVRETDEHQKIELLANLQLFISPRYKYLDGLSLTTCFRLVASLLNGIPVPLINPSSSRNQSGSTRATWDNGELDSDSDSEGKRTRVTVVSTFISPGTLSMPKKSVPPPDSRTLKRVSGLSTATHINTLLSLSSSASLSPDLISLLLALMAIWPTDVQTRIVAASPALIREIYRIHVRASGVGRDGGSVLIADSNSDAAWPPLLLLVELYTKAMLTMGDDEFFGTSSGSASLNSTARTLGAPALLGEGREAPIARNPLSLDELVDWSRQLLNIAFSLFWGEDPRALQKLVGGGVRYTWEDVRERVTACLVAIHARDSRRPFVPEGHWLITSQIDVQSFIDAAIFEEQELTSSPSSSRTQSKRQLAHLSPRLGVLNNIPFSIPFDVRVLIFRQFVLNDMRSRAPSRAMYMGPRRTRISVRREHVAEDGFDKLSDVDLKRPVEIVFIDQFGTEEAGIDGGGVFKEFFTSLCKQVFDTDRGLWLANKKNELYPNPHAYATESHSLNWYRFIGRILGKAMYEGILVDVAFAGFFLAKWLGRQSFLDDLASLDPDLYSGLIFLKHYKGNLEDLALNFTIAIDDFGETKSFDLIPGGSNIAVTRENRLQYIQIVSHYRLTKQIKKQSEAFFDGLSEIIDPKWIRMFNQQEIQVLLGGVNAPIDFDDLRSNTHYGGLYDDNQDTVVAFWKVVNTFDQQQRMALLRFVTSCSRPPLLGFKELVPNFSIRDSSSDQHRLPTSSTCVNLLKLPRYTSEKVLREKLLQAINSNAGFDLS